MNEEVGRMLVTMAAAGKLNTLKILIENWGVNLGASTTDGKKALMSAVQYGHLDVVKYLIEKHNVPTSSITDENGLNITPLFIALKNGYLHIVKYLVETKGESIMHESHNGLTAVFYAAMSGRAELLQYLVENKCNVQCTDNKGCTPLHWAAMSPNDKADGVAYLIDECGCDPLQPDSQKMTSLHLACLHGCINVVKYLVEVKNCNPLRVYASVCSPLGVACQNQLDVVKYIVEEKKMDPRQDETLIGNPCHLAVGVGDLEVVKYFIENGHCELTDINNMGISLAEGSIARDRCEVLKYLIEQRGLDPMSADCRGDTLLHLAHEQNAVECAEYLMHKQHLTTHSEDSGHRVHQLAPGQGMPRGQHCMRMCLLNKNHILTPM